jgi:hypothetical protein
VPQPNTGRVINDQTFSQAFRKSFPSRFLDNNYLHVLLLATKTSTIGKNASKYSKKEANIILCRHVIVEKLNAEFEKKIIPRDFIR